MTIATALPDKFIELPLSVKAGISARRTKISARTRNKKVAEFIDASRREFDSLLKTTYREIESHPKTQEYDPDNKCIETLELVEKKLKDTLNDPTHPATKPIKKHYVYLINASIDLRWHIMTRDGLIAAAEVESEKTVSGKELVEILRSA